MIPGTFNGLVLVLYNKFVSKKRGYAPATQDVQEKGANVFKEAIWAIIMPVIVLGGIYAGIFTPTEAAVVGVVYALFVGKFIYHQLTLRKFLDGLLELRAFRHRHDRDGRRQHLRPHPDLGKGPNLLTDTLLSISSSPIVVMLMMNVLLLIAGMFIDTTSNIILFAPLLCLWPPRWALI